MDRNRDGMVTIDEFIETCQKVTSWQSRPGTLSSSRLDLWSVLYFPQDENIMSSMQLFENVI